ncbi:MAG: serine/threonine-protein kinase [Myxococcota bacterium]
MTRAADETTGEPRPWALADRLVQAQVEAQLLGQAADPMTLGRYRVERGLGSGAMGRLLLAFDPDLRRRVALKLITPTQAGSSEARRRIVREARAMAQLSDPHVAQVYEVGEASGQLFVAIEYVDGRDLRTWLSAGARRWTEVLAVFAQAGAGLAAAHDKGIVHRDFKPDNVMLEHDGRARVIDFGLAFPGLRDARGPGGAHPSVSDEPVELTQTGLVVGTPAYIAPEQWNGAAAQPRSDQFAFCVSLYEALTGKRPFAGETIEQIRQAQHEGIPRWPGPAPRWVGRILHRGLRVDPAARWPDMRTLLRALDPGRRRRRTGVVAAAAGLVAVVGLMSTLTPEDPCREAAVPLREHWGPTQHEAIMAAGAGTDAVWGEATAVRLVTRLDAQAEAWRVAARGLCAAARAGDGGHDPAGAACLDVARRRLSRAVSEAVSGEATLLVSAVARAELLPDPRSCLEAPRSALGGGTPVASELPELLTAVERNLGATVVRSEATRYVDATSAARAAVDEAVEQAEADGDPSSLARALWLAGRVSMAEAQIKAAERDFRRARVMAQRAAEAPLAAAITTELVYVVARDRERFREAEDLATEATGMIAALGEPPLLDARLRSHWASALAHARDGERDQAVRLHEQAVARLVGTLGARHPHAIIVTGNLGAALNYARRPADAEARLTEALAAARATWGDEHPRTALLLGTLGLARMRQGDLEGGEQHLRRSLEIREAVLGSDHAQVDDARYNLASLLRRREEHQKALPLLEQGLGNSLRRLDPDDARLGPWWVAAGESSVAVGDHERAREALAAALRVFERTGAQAGDYARVRLGLARAWSAADPEYARSLARQALADAIEADATQVRSEVEALLEML